MAMGAAVGDFELGMDELRAVARYAAESAEQVLTIFEAVHPEDTRPRAAIDAAWAFANGAPRTRLQRVTAVDAHRAAASTTDEAAKHAARAAGDAAAAAYLHPLANSTQVGHILGAAAHAVRAAELSEGDDPDVGAVRIEQAGQRATPVLITVLRRYPPAAGGKSRAAQLMTALDTSLRTPGSVPDPQDEDATSADCRRSSD